MKYYQIYTISDKTLKNGRLTVNLDVVTILYKELIEVVISDYQENADQHCGCKIFLRCNSSTIDTSNYPEDTIHIIGENVFVELEALTDKQQTELLNNRDQNFLVIIFENLVEAIKETILNGINKKTELSQEVHELTGESKYIIYHVLDLLGGEHWRMTRGPNKSKIYSLL